jgi:hypothetical protein
VDPSETANILRYMQMFGHPPPGITPENLKLIQALSAAKQRQVLAPPPTPLPATSPPQAGMPVVTQPGGVPRIDTGVAASGG